MSVSPPLAPPTASAPLPYPSASGPRRSNPVGGSALILGALGVLAAIVGAFGLTDALDVLFVGTLVAAPLGLAALVLGVVGLLLRRRRRGAAVAGTVLGFVAVVVAAAVLVLAVQITSAKWAAAVASAMATATPEPVDVPAYGDRQGTGSDVITVQIDEPVVVRFICTTCEVRAKVTSDSATTPTLLDRVGAYDGRRFVHPGDGISQLTIRVDEGAAWQLAWVPWSVYADEIPTVAEGEVVRGLQDDVVLFADDVERARYVNDGSADFSVVALDDARTELVAASGDANEVADAAPGEYAQVSSDGLWKIKGR